MVARKRVFIQSIWSEQLTEANPILNRRVYRLRRKEWKDFSINSRCYVVANVLQTGWKQWSPWTEWNEISPCRGLCGPGNTVWRGWKAFLLFRSQSLIVSMQSIVSIISIVSTLSALELHGNFRFSSRENKSMLIVLFEFCRLSKEQF